MISLEERQNRKLAKISKVSEEFINIIKQDHEFRVDTINTRFYSRDAECKYCGMHIHIVLNDRRKYTQISNYRVSIYNRTIPLSKSKFRYSTYRNNNLQGITCSYVKFLLMEDALG